MEQFRKRLLSNQPLAGTWINLGSSIIAEMAASATFDWLLFDLEHGTLEFSDLLHQLQAIAAYRVTGIVRVPAIDPSVFKRILDLGAHGLMVPNVKNVADAEECVRYARVPPQGIRGAAQTTRASGYGVGYLRYVREVNQQQCIVAQIESAVGVDNADEIAAVDGIDVLFVGPTDLSVDLGCEPNYDGGEFYDALKTVQAAAARHGKAAGVLIRNREQARAYRNLGFTMIALGSDRGLLAGGMRENAITLSQVFAGDETEVRALP